ncbi:hypothetical protein ACJ73_04597 [Blastomyces percursus]|uniref:Uncharacterized protein n=1 Tax=Blastomyces percursus TaxID=1658174 RepID=A0A1J9R6B6_9EURO|nr:hypothetical protein ACJ73_04597 [Blastomyces percursus]
MKLSVLSAAFALAGSAIAAPAPIIPGLPNFQVSGRCRLSRAFPMLCHQDRQRRWFAIAFGPLQGLLGGGLGGLPLPLKARQDVEAEISGMTPEQAAQMIQSIKEIASALQIDKAIDGKLPEVPGFSKEKQEQLLEALKALVAQLAPLAKDGLKDIAPKLDAINVPVQGLTARDPIIGGLPIVGGLLNGGAGGILSVVAGPLSILTQVLGMTGVAPLLGPVLSTISGLGL